MYLKLAIELVLMIILAVNIDAYSLNAIMIRLLQLWSVLDYVNELVTRHKVD